MEDPLVNCQILFWLIYAWFMPESIVKYHYYLINHFKDLFKKFFLMHSFDELSSQILLIFVKLLKFSEKKLFRKNVSAKHTKEDISSFFQKRKKSLTISLIFSKNNSLEKKSFFSLLIIDFSFPSLFERRKKERGFDYQKVNNIKSQSNHHPTYLRRCTEFEKWKFNQLLTTYYLLWGYYNYKEPK